MSFEIQTTEYGKISASFSQASLAKLCVEKIGVQTGPFGSQLHNEDYVDIGTPIITVEHLGENRITYQNMPCVSDEDKARLSKYCLQEGDIVFSRVGSVDRRALVRQEEDGWLFSGRCLRVRVDTAKIDPVYLSYFFGLEGFKNYIKSIAVGATMPSINTKILSDVPIYFPELENQKKIGKILQELDDKIELNRQINKTLEAIAQAIFKSWFVDFEPVKAKIAAIEAGEDDEGVTRAAMRAISGKTDDELDKMQAEQPEHYGQLKTTAELFPAAMQDSELGEVPVGWGFSKIGRELKTVLGGTPSTTNKSYWKNGMIAWINSGKINEFRITEPTAYITEEAVNNSATKLLPKGTTVLAITGATLGQVSRIEIDTCANQSVVGVIESESIPSEYIYFWIKHNIFNIISWQSGGAQQHINKNNINNSPLLIPDSRILNSYLKIAKPIFDKVASNCFENLDLSQIRDYLLPKLLSGELSVDAVELAEEN